MASRSSANFLSETYQGSKRGREVDNDISLDMFPGKYEATAMEHSPDELDNDRRMTLDDYSPDVNNMFAYELPRRNNYSRSHLQLREGGVFGSSAMPWITYNSVDDNRSSGTAPNYLDLYSVAPDTSAESYDISFHDKDPRGAVTDQPWDEYRRLITANMQRFDFRDDGDNSVTGGGVSPWTLYSRIRDAQNWTKARLKIFDDSYINQHTGGVGTFADLSKVFHSSTPEDTSVLTDRMSETIEDRENRQRLTMHLSNLVHGGSPFLRANTTTDHKVAVSAYGKLYAQRGLLKHETQMRMIEEDTPWSRIEGSTNTPKNLVKLMANALEDESLMHPRVAANSARLMYQDNALSSHNQQLYEGMRGDESEMSNRGLMLTRDIMSLLGFTAQEIKFLESSEGVNRSQAKHALANLHQMAEVLHAMPAHVKLELRNELVLRSSGFGLLNPSGQRKTRDQVEVNPKILHFMEYMSRKTVKPGNNHELLTHGGVEGDPENKLARPEAPLFTKKSTSRYSEDLLGNKYNSSREIEKYTGPNQRDATKTASYKGLVSLAKRVGFNARQQNSTQDLVDPARAPIRKTPAALGNHELFENYMKTELDTQFPDTPTINRHIAPVGNKNMRRYMDTDYATNDMAREIDGPARTQSHQRAGRIMVV